MSGQASYLSAYSSAKRIVIKIGSALLVDDDGVLRLDWLAALGQDIAALRARGTDVIIVSSGAVALGRTRLGLVGKKLELSEKQACAAAGQSHLTQRYEDVLAPHGVVTAQALLTLVDTENRRLWLNARSTIETLLTLGAVPIVNENDTVATDEIKYGDNDRLAARVAQMIGADVLVLLSDIDGLYTADPRNDPRAAHIPIIESITADIEAMGGEPNAVSGIGSGGMATKIAAAKIATQAGCNLVITKGEVHRPLSALESGARASWFTATTKPETARKQWIMGSLSTLGVITIDAGALAALLDGNSLLAAGVTAVDGDFQKGEAVTVTDNSGAILARGLIAYSSDDARKIIGLKSGDIEAAVGYKSSAAFIHRDDLVMEKALS